MKVTILAAGLAAVALSGCSGISYVLDNYKGVEVKEVSVEGDDDYRVFDKPEAGRMMITSSLGAAAGQGAVKGLFLGAVDTSPPKPRFLKAAETYLATTGRQHCKIKDGYLLVSPQWEFLYDCAVPKVVVDRAKRRG